MQKPRLSERFKYWFDGVMSKGTIALIGLLFVATIVMIVLAGLILWITRIPPVDGGAPLDFLAATWSSLMHSIDGGTLTADEGYAFRTVMLFVTIGGVIVVAGLIGVVSNAFNLKLEDLRKGRSQVLEKDHTLILGWNSKVFPIISELAIANQSRRGAAIVVLADQDKVEMEDAIAARVGNLRKTRVIVRSGSPTDITDLEISSPHTARSIIILAPEDHPDPDSVVVKTALAVTNNPHRKAGDYHLVGEIENPEYMEAAKLVGRHEAHWILGNDLISRITVQSSRQSGLSVVYSELLDFDGDEIYFSDQPSLVGGTYLSAQLAFDTSSLIGLVVDGAVVLNPSGDTVIGASDRLILIAEDDSTIALAAAPGTSVPSAIAPPRRVKKTPERTLVLGYNSSLTVMLTELNEYVAPRSTVIVVSDVDVPPLGAFSNMKVEVRTADSASRAVLDGLDPTTFDHIMLLAYREDLDVQQADTKTLITLLHLRQIEENAGLDLTIVSEMLDDKNRELAEVTKADDFIVSDKLVSLLLSQVSENKQLTDVFDTLFSANGSEIYLRDVEDYIVAGSTVDFFTVVDAATRRGETAIGYRVAAEARNAETSYGVRVNPRKSDTVNFVPGDKIIVLAQD